ncbi:flagellar export protein FliJ [Solimicrobium silvestre]|uniref:Flagellar FliJ protein n=1 Tax=Solimicrobium silvestre TaxID=2099400 RepID=A0A2S9GSU9_9BURK|nr:flagellar export protein FliJ [Solimicrobium silvestre]PRC90781.1 Flagellar export protein FliJ [Solimicrobium silvestre]
MAQSSPLTTLIELAERMTDEAAAKLGLAIRSCDELEQKLNLLKKYRDDYSLKMQAELKVGRNMQHIRNFQLFLGKIDDAIKGQQLLVISAQQRVLVARQNWQDQERKRMSYSTLEVRAEKVQQKKEARRDQRQNDEHGTRQAFFKR